MKTLLAACLLALGLAAVSPAYAEEPPAAPAAATPAPEAKPAPDARPAGGPMRHPGMMAMKPLVCREVTAGKGKSGAELATAIEQLGAQMIHGGYHLSAIVQGDPPIACFANFTDPSKLPLGAR